MLANCILVGDQLTLAMGMPVTGDYQALVTKVRYGVANEFECTYVRKDGTGFPVLLAVTALGGGDNDLAGYPSWPRLISASGTPFER